MHASFASSGLLRGFNHTTGKPSAIKEQYNGLCYIVAQVSANYNAPWCTCMRVSDSSLRDSGTLRDLAVWFLAQTPGPGNFG
jgi:hypothetical protein